MSDRAEIPLLVRKLRAALALPGAPTRGEHLLIAVSGGPDSTALFAALAEIAPERGFRLTAAHVDHELRGAEGRAEGESVAALATHFGIRALRRSSPVAPGSGVEARARRARYRAFATMATEVGATRIVTAHTRDDQVETVLLRLLRGAGRRGLGGMAAVRGRLFRPLLDATRTDVRRFLAERALSFAVDRTNADLRFMRNRVRRLLVPFLESEFNPRLGESLAGLAVRLRDEDDLLAELTRPRASALRRGETLSVEVAAEPRALARRIVRAWLEHGAYRTPSAHHVECVLALAMGAARGAVAVPGPARIVREGDVLVRHPGRVATVRPFLFPIAPGQAVAHPTGGWRLRLSTPRSRRVGEQRVDDPAHALFDADELPSTLVVRSPEPGDRLRLLGGGSRKLQDVLVDAKVPRARRAAAAVLASGGEILWVAGVARGRGATIRPATSRVVEGLLERNTGEP